MSSTSQLSRFGPLLLSPGIAPRQVLTFYLAAFFGVCIVTFLNSAQPYLLTTILAIPQAEQGALVGRLSAFQELVVILAAGPLGVLADRLPRRVIYVLGYLLLALGFFLYPLATDVSTLYAVRFVFALGVSCYAVALAALAVDYPSNQSRGKFLAIQVVVTGLAIFLFARPLLGQLANFYAEAGFDPITTGRLTFWTVAVLALVTAVLCFFGLKARDEVVPPPSNTQVQVPMRVMLKDGIQLARTTPSIGLAYITSFATRGDFTVITLFMSLWFSQASADAATGLAAFYARFGAIQVVAVLWAPVMGLILDRVDRVSGVVLAMAIATIAYCSLWWVDDPNSGAMWVAVVLLGLAETSTIMAGSALIGEHAPEETRGSIIGMFTLLGGCGIFAASIVGGMLFSWSPAGPFLFMAAVNLVVMLVALRVRFQ